jgi:hypothetical protein
MTPDSAPIQARHIPALLDGMVDAIAPTVRQFVTEQLVSLQSEIQKLRADNLKLHDRLAEVETKAHAPMAYKGVWAPSTEHPAGSTCTWQGSMWVAVRDTAVKPGEGIEATGWQLACKRGSDGASAFEVAKRNGFSGDEKAFASRLMRTATPPPVIA